MFEEPTAPDAAARPIEGPCSWPEVTDEMMMEGRQRTREYSLVILKAGPNYSEPGADKIIWEHGRRNLSMRAAGLICMIFPVPDTTEVCGVGIFDADLEAVERLILQDPAVQAGIMRFEVHPTRSFPGDTLPGRPGTVSTEDAAPARCSLNHVERESTQR